MDWKDSLASLMADMPGGETPAEGNDTTIVCGFTVDDGKVEEIAAHLKKSLGTGGSARGGEILIQGDKRSEVEAALKAIGLKCRVI